MRIKLTKNWIKPNGKIIPKGRTFFATKELAQELIKKRMAKEFKEVTVFDFLKKKETIEFETKDEHLTKNKHGNNRNS